MAVGILLISHNQIGVELITTAKQMLSCQTLPSKVISIAIEDNPELIKSEMQAILEELDQGQGILILTDMFGSTPSNIACEVSERHDVRIISGLNLPMLIRVLNYPSLSLNDLEHKAISGGQQGIARCHLTGCSYD